LLITSRKPDATAIVRRERLVAKAQAAAEERDDALGGLDWDAARVALRSARSVAKCRQPESEERD
jgi:hypothetical protein